MCSQYSLWVVCSAMVSSPPSAKRSSSAQTDSWKREGKRQQKATEGNKGPNHSVKVIKLSHDVTAHHITSYHCTCEAQMLNNDLTGDMAPGHMPLLIGSILHGFAHVKSEC